MCMRQRSSGFTLIELVVVIVLLGITSVTLTVLITGSVRGYLDTANRQDSAAIARIALDRMGRELREAMPQSARVSADGKCIQFLPVATSFSYLSLTAGITDVRVIEPPLGFAVPSGALFAAVYPANAGELYSLAAMRGVTINGVSNNQRTLTLSGAFASPHPRNGPGQRIYIVGRPVSYCVTAAGLLLRSVDDVNVAQPAANALAAPTTLADRVNYANSSFASNTATWQNNSLIKIVLTLLQSNGESLSLDHEIGVRNVQ